MSILTANLKHLYQRRGLWLIYVFLGFLMISLLTAPLERPEAGKGRFAGPVVAAFIIGLLATSLQMDILSKPLSYCLPGHRRAVRRYVLCIGAGVNVLASMIFLAYPHVHGPQLLLVLCSAVSAGLTFYMAGAAFALVGIKAAIGFVLIPLAVGAGELYDLDVLLERIIVENCYPVILAGILSSVGMWLWLSSRGLARKRCGVLWVGLLDVFNAKKLKRCENARAAIKWKRLKEHPRPWVEKLFLSRMDKYDYSGPGRYIWGVLYSTSALALSRWPNLLLLVLVFAIMFGYIGQDATFVLILLPAMLVLGRHLTPIHSTMLISGGRRRRFTTALALAATDAALLCIATLIISGLSMLLAALMPDFTFAGNTFSFQPIDPRVALVPLIFLPIASTIQLAFRRMPFSVFSALTLSLYAVIFLAIVWHENLGILVNPLFVAGVAAAGWGIFLIVLRQICMNRCLVGRGHSH